MTAELGFVGLGQMGAPMAERLLGAGARLHVFDAAPEAMAPLVGSGAIGHASVRSLADVASIVFACLPSREISESVSFGERGVATGAAVKIYVEMSTIGSACVETIAKRLAERGIRTVDAPVSGGPPAARRGTLTMMAAGADADLAEIRPWLGKIGHKVFVLGNRPGQAQIMKLVNNIVMATNMVVASEGLVMAVAAGLEPGLAVDVLNSGTGRSAASSDLLVPSALSGKFDFGARLSIVAKDVELGLAEAQALRTPVSVIEQAAELWKAAADQGRGDEDFTAIIKLVEEKIGVLVRRAS